MSLEHTNYGLSNEHLFYNVSAVVYCEGRADDGVTHDEMFWSKVLTEFGISCVCKSRGSKTDIIPLAQRAIESGVKNVFFAMDRDYGDYYGLPLQDKIIIYTYGYSWENDIIYNINASAVFSMFAPVINGDSVDSDLREFISAAADSSARVAQMDIRNTITQVALFDRSKPVSIFIGVGQDLRFNEEAISQKFAEISQREVMQDIVVEQIEWLREFYGKACSRMIYQWFVDRSQSYGDRSKIPYAAFLRLCISTMNFDVEVSARDRYYHSLAANLPK